LDNKHLKIKLIKKKFSELDDYKSNDHFFLTSNKDLKEVCNAPENGMGVYTVYRLKDNNIDLVYIGSSGKIKTRSNRLADSIINGKQFGSPRRDTWKQKIKDENIDALDIYWNETFDEEIQEIPAFFEAFLLQNFFFNLYGMLPLWNKEL